MTQPEPSCQLLVGCGILQKEIRFLIEKNNWPLETHFLDSGLHIDFDRLSRALTGALQHYRDRDPIVFYGACHPLMDRMLDAAATFRTSGQNCIEMLLGHERFTAELEQGAFFLLEEWALRWEQIVTATFGTNTDIIREVYRGDRNYLLGITTPCSHNFNAAAEQAGRMVGLPLRWLDTSLDRLETVLQEALHRKTRESLCPR